MLHFTRVLFIALLLVSCKGSADQLSKELEIAVEAINGQAPITQDGLTFNGATTEGHRVTYWFTTHVPMPEIVIQQIKDVLPLSVCSSKTVRHYINKGVLFVYTYTNEQAETLVSVNVSSEICNNLGGRK
jgi:hypothetical protein